VAAALPATLRSVTASPADGAARGTPCRHRADRGGAAGAAVRPVCRHACHHACRHAPAL